MSPSSKKSGLGRGLDSLFEDNEIIRDKNLSQMIRLSDIEPTRSQPRKAFDEEALASLAASISSVGLLQPIIVTENTSFPGTYRIIAGERRWRACKLAGLVEAPCIVFSGDELTQAEVALVENIQRKDLNAVEEATAFQNLIDRFGLTQEQVAEKTGRSRPAITNALRLLSLPEEVLVFVKDGRISAGHARALLGLKKQEDMGRLAQKIADGDYSVRETEREVKAMNRPQQLKIHIRNEQMDLYIADLERKALRLGGHRLKIDDRGEGKRRITVEYSDNEDLEGLLVKLCGKDIISQ